MILDTVGFFVHTPLLFNHYQAVWRLLNPSSFEIILSDDFAHPPYLNSVKSLTEAGYRYRLHSRVMDRHLKYRYLVTNHVGIPQTRRDRKQRISGLPRRIMKSAVRRLKKRRKKLTPSRKGGLNDLAVHNIRFMYGADLSEWSLSSWNNIYDLFLCHGPIDAQEIQSRFPGKVLQMGYPRYDSYFNNPPRKEELKVALGLDPNRQTIVWLPTAAKEQSFFESYLDEVELLTEDYNVILRPHPLTREWAPRSLLALSRYSFTICDDPLQDMNVLYGVSDYVFCDYGGTAYSALYLDCQVLLLDHPMAAEDIAYRSIPSVDLRKHLLSISPGNAAQLRGILDDPRLWKEQVSVRSELREKFFAPRQGTSALFVADVLNDIRKIIS